MNCNYFYYGITTVIVVSCCGKISGVKFNNHYDMQSSNSSVFNGLYYVDLIGSIMSPNYDNSDDYLDSLDVYWVLVSPPSLYEISLNFLFFSTEVGYDHLYIYSGNGVDDKNLLLRYSGYKEPFQVKLNYSTITVRFMSDDNITANGFYAMYSIPAHLQTKLFATSDIQYITLPTYPSPYEPNTNLYWILNAPISKQVKLDWIELNTVPNQDFVIVYDGCGLLTTTFTKFSGNSTSVKSFTSSTNCLTIQFTSDRSEQKPIGFKVGYSSVTVLCDDKPYHYFGNATNEMIVSPNFPYNYCNDITKLYYILVPYNFVVYLNFTNISLFNNDYLYIYDKYGSYSNPNDRLTYQSVAPYHFWSTGRYLTLEFSTDSSNTSTGFKATFSSVYQTNERHHRNYNGGDDDSLDGGQIAEIIIGATILMVIIFLAIAFVITSKKKRRLDSNHASINVAQFPSDFNNDEKLHQPFFIITSTNKSRYNVY